MCNPLHGWMNETSASGWSCSVDCLTPPDCADSFPENGTRGVHGPTCTCPTSDRANRTVGRSERRPPLTPSLPLRLSHHPPPPATSHALPCSHVPPAFLAPTIHGPSQPTGPRTTGRRMAAVAAAAEWCRRSGHSAAITASSMRRARTPPAGLPPCRCPPPRPPVKEPRQISAAPAAARRLAAAVSGRSPSAQEAG